MIQKFFIFLFLVLHLSLHAQNTFFKWYPTDQDELPYPALELSGGDFLIGGGVGPEYYSTHQKYLLKIDHAGNVLDSKTGESSNTTTLYACLFSLPGDVAGFGAVVDYMYSNNGHNYTNISLDKYNVDFDLISKKIFTFPADYGLFPQYCLGYTDSLFLIQSNEITYLPYFHHMASVVTKFNYQYDSLASYIETENNLTGFGILANTISNTVKCFNYISAISTSMSEIDMNMQLVKKSTLPWLITTPSAASLNDSSYVVTGVVSHLANTKHHLKVWKFNTNDGIIDSVEYSNNPDTVLYGGWMQNTLRIGNQIFVVGNYNFDPIHFPFPEGPTWIQITRLDTNMQIIDHHFYGGDAAYNPYNIINTSDGGALIIGNRYDYYSTPNNQYDVFALKVNSDGLITELPEQPQAKAHDAIVYPNPGREWLNIQSGPQISGAAFTLYDMKGRPLLSQQINNTQLKLNTAALPSGIYPWQIVFKNKLIESGKWVKE